MAPKGFKRQPHVAQALNELGKYVDAHEDEAMPCLLVVLVGRFNQSKSSFRDIILAYAKVDRLSEKKTCWRLWSHGLPLGHKNTGTSFGTLSTAMEGKMIGCAGSSLPR